MPQHKLVLLALAALAVTACGSNDPVPDPDAEQTTVDGGYGDQDVFSSDGLNDGEEVPYGGFDDEELATVIYFEYDSSELRAEDTDLVARHAQQLGSNGSMRIRLEGHADERGSREYNIGLGERRAQTVRRLLLIQGANADQVATVSFGEERPAVEGSSEAAYSQNRRVEIAYTN